jgi:hypothetical protein
MTPPGFLGGKKTLPMDFGRRAESGGRVGADARHVPFSSEIEYVSQQHQHAVAGSGSVAVVTHVIDQIGDAVAGEFADLGFRANGNLRPISIMSFRRRGAERGFGRRFVPVDRTCLAFVTPRWPPCSIVGVYL